MIDKLSINTIRFLGIDAINKANSGHPGIVLGAAPMAHTLFTKHLNIYPKKSDWLNRDRFILSAGHGSMLLYGLLHLSGFKITIDDLKNFRQPGNTPGHPEYGDTDGVEATSGPLGQGIANAVGMAIAESFLSAKFNKADYPLIDHYTYVLCGDGDLQEGIAQEAISLAGHLALNKLIVLFDSNDIQLDGPTAMATSDDHKKRFTAVGWNYLLVDDGTDLVKIHQALLKAKRALKPTLIEIKTAIGYGSPLEGTSKSHGAPIGNEARNETALKLEYPYQPFEVDEKVKEFYHKKVYNRGRNNYNKWRRLEKKYQENFPQDYQKFLSFYQEIKVDLASLPRYQLKTSLATRNASGEALTQLSKQYENIIGGSADLTGSTKAKGLAGDFTKENHLGRNINFGVREHAMGSIVNGMALHGGVKPFGGGFLVFSDYLKPSLRMAALMKIPAIFVFSHDSLLVGEDGPTHQPVEQLAMLRSIPNLTVFRPADANETVQAWAYALENKGPTVLVLTRQNVTTYSDFDANFKKGAYVIAAEKGELAGILLASGSEVSLAITVKEELEKEGIYLKVVSMPSQELFLKQSEAYQKAILNHQKVVAIEMASTMPWYRFTNHVYGIDSFGLSAPMEVIKNKFKFTKESIIEYYKSIK
jgi:transketolase